MHKNLGLLVRVPMITLLLVTAFAWSGVSPVSADWAPVDSAPVIGTGQGCPNPNRYHTLSYAHSGGWAIYPKSPFYGGNPDGGNPDGGSIDSDGTSSCDGSFAVTEVWSTETAQYRWHLNFQGFTRLCNVYVDIPWDSRAGDLHQYTYTTDARYDFWGQNNHWLGWPGHTVNQKANLGFSSVEIAHHLDVHKVTTLTVTLSNKSRNTNEAVGAGGMLFQCL